MKTLILIRHAKSDWGYEFLQDIDRPLNERGYRDAYQLSKWYKEHYPYPQVIISSPATRAISTALIFARALSYNEENIIIKKNIYYTSVDAFLSTIHTLSDSVDIAMFFGHNPVITDLCNSIANDFFIDNIPTCGIMKLDFNINTWKLVGEAKSEKVEYKFAK